VNVEVFFKDETVWLTQKAIGELFGKERSVITKHLKNIFASGELEEKSNVQKMHFSQIFSLCNLLSDSKNAERNREMKKKLNELSTAEVFSVVQIKGNEHG